MTFSGRAARSENWYWVLFSIVASTAASVLGGAFFPYGMVSPLNTVFGLVTLLPSLAIGFRRLHDIDRTAR